jgi:hypothetical protein
VFLSNIASVIILLLYIWFEHPGHTYRGFGPTFSDRGMTESEEYDAKENSCATKIDPLTQKFWGLDFNKTSASEKHWAEHEFQAHPSDGKKKTSSKISSDTVLDKLRNRLSGPALPTVPCILGPFKVNHALCDWGASMNILPKMVYDCMDKDPLVPTSQCLQLTYSIVVQP